MFTELTTMEHIFLSIFLHVLGMGAGIFVWHLFPRNPTRYITKIPIEKMALLVTEEDETAQVNKNVYNAQPTGIRNYG